MEKLKVLDCTLRDGGYYTNWDFEDSLVNQYIDAVNQLPIDYVEVGYRSKEIGGYLGPYFYTSTKLIKSLYSRLEKASLTLMIDVKNTSIEDIPDLFVDIKEECKLVRMAVAPDKLENAIRISRKLKDMGFKTALNLMYMSKVEVSNSLLEELMSYNDSYDYLYLVDSYGGMTPQEITSKFSKCKNLETLGFHGHNNLELALANTISAIQAGAGIVDATITGMGRGAGNLKTELLLTYLQSRGEIDANLNKLSEVVKQFEDLRANYKWGTNLPYMLSGGYNLPQKDVMEWLGTNRYTINTIVHSLLNETLDSNLARLNKTQFKGVGSFYIIGGGPTMDKVKEGFIDLIENKNDVLIYHSSSRYANDFVSLANKSLIGLAGSEADKLVKRVGDENLSKYNYLLAASPREMQTEIPIGIGDSVFELSESYSEYGDSPIGIGFDLAKMYGINEVFILGFDGYYNPSAQQLMLMEENQTAIDKFVKDGGKVVSLTKSSYKRIIRESIYSKL